MLDRVDQQKQSLSLKDDGFEHFFFERTELNVDVDKHLDSIKREFDELDRDPYGIADNRFRSYARGILLPWKPEFSWIPPTKLVRGRPMTEYYQGAYNPDFSGEKRVLPAISEKAKSNPLLHRLIWADFDRSFWPDSLRSHPLQVGVSFIKLQVDTEHPRALSTPDSFHQDGETFTFAHLISRMGVVGGINSISYPAAAGKGLADIPHGQVLAEFELCQPLETYAIFDPLVSHYVSPIELADGCEKGERSIMLVDFTPMVPLHHVGQ
jgi:hypothetical protein